MPMKHLFVLIVCLGFCHCGYSQNLYGKATVGYNHNLQQFSINTLGDTPIIQNFNVGNDFYSQSTSDLKSLYVHMSPNIYFDSTLPWEIFIVDVKKKTLFVDTVQYRSFSFPEYHDDTLWGLSSTGINYYDFSTNTVHVYHNVGFNNENPFYYLVQKSAFNHDSMIYMFTKRGVYNSPVDTFYYYRIRTRQLSRSLVPRWFIEFDYLPLNDRCYFISNNNKDSVQGFYEYDYYKNKLTLHKATADAHGGEATLDPIKNRMYFVAVRKQVNKISYDTIGCYRINNKKTDFYAPPKGDGWVAIEYLNTFNDTTHDYPLSVSSIDNEPTLVVYPNPAKNILTVETILVGEAEAVVWDMQGRILKRSKLNIKEGKLIEDVSSLRNGKYILGISSSMGEQSTVFTVER